MPRYLAFLRAINVGGHNVKMDALRQLFESLGFSAVETFIASGNVIFETTARNPPTLEAKIEAELRKSLGYAVDTFLRTPAELAAIAAYRPFPQARLDAAGALNVAFLAAPLDAAAKRKLAGFKTEIDDFTAHAREVYWLCLKKQSESTFSNAVFEKALGVRATWRGISTVQKMAAKYATGM